MANEAKKKLKAETAGADAAAGAEAAVEAQADESVKVIANPGCFTGGVGQVAIRVNGVKYFIHTNRPTTVSREIYEEMRRQDLRGRQAVILD